MYNIKQCYTPVLLKNARERECASELEKEGEREFGRASERGGEK